MDVKKVNEFLNEEIGVKRGGGVKTWLMQKALATLSVTYES